MKVHLWIIVTLCWLSWLTSSRAADDPHLQERRRFLLSGMRAEREKLRSGQVVLLGEHSKRSTEVGEYRLPVRFEVAFDHDAQKYRYTASDHAAIDATGVDPKLKAQSVDQGLPHGKTPEGIEWFTMEGGGTVVHTPEYDLHRAIDSKSVTRHAPGNVTGTSVREWDLRLLGLVDWFSFNGRSQYQDVLDAQETRLACQAVNLDASGLSRLTLRSGNTETEIWIDEKKGMTPVRISRTEIGSVRRETSRSEVGWEETNGVWVPTSFNIYGDMTPTSSERYDLTLEWSQVNEPLDAQQFTPAGITDSDSALVADMRLGQVVVEPVNPGHLPDLAIKADDSEARPWLVPLVLVNLVAITVAWWIYRRLRKPTS